MGAQFSDYEFGFRYGSRYTMDRTSYKDCNFNIATDTGTLSLDIEGKRVELTDIITGYSEVEIRAIPIPSNKIYLSNDTYNLLVFDFENSVWRKPSAEITLHAQMADEDGNGSNIATTYETKVHATATENNLKLLINNLRDEITTLSAFKIVVLSDGEELPETGTKFVIYFVPSHSDNGDNKEETDNIYAEYIWIETEEFDAESGEMVVTGGYYEQLGLTTADLTNYYKKSETLSTTEIDEVLTNYYKKTEPLNFEDITATFDSVPTSGSTNLITSGGVYDYIDLMITQAMEASY